MVSMGFKPTFFAAKLSLRRAIASLDMSALTAFLGSVMGVNFPHFHALGFSFVGDKCLELSKATHKAMGFLAGSS